MNAGIIIVVLGFLLGWNLYARYTGCSNGHVWGDETSTGRVEITPYYNKDSVSVREEYEKECQCDGCNATQTSWSEHTPKAYSESVSIDVSEVKYKCPSCGELVRTSKRDTEWSYMGAHGGRKRFERCPSCGEWNPASFWERVSYDEVSE